MIIGIDGNEANVSRRVGIGEYAFALLEQFAAAAKENIRFVIYLKDKPLPHMPKENEYWQYKVIGPRRFWTQCALPFSLFTQKIVDIFFTPTHYAPRFSPISTAVSIMDLSYLHFPQLFAKNDLYQLTNWTAYSVRNAAKVFTISVASKNDIIEKYRVPASRIVVTYPGIKKESVPMNQDNMQMVEKKYDIQGEYVLFVGTLQPRKNIVRLIEAFAKVKEQKKDISLVIVGKRGWLYEDILAAPSKYGVSSSVKFLDFVDDTSLALLYKNARCFVLPSLYEGFGLPVLEAMKNGCPVITSNISSLPEVGGDAALYVDPLSVEDIAEKIGTVIEDKKLRDTMIAKGKKQVQKFSWEKTAKETLAALLAMGGHNEG